MTVAFELVNKNTPKVNSLGRPELGCLDDGRIILILIPFLIVMQPLACRG